MVNLLNGIFILLSVVYFTVSGFFVDKISSLKLFERKENVIKKVSIDDIDICSSPTTCHDCC